MSFYLKNKSFNFFERIERHLVEAEKKRNERENSVVIGQVAAKCNREFLGPFGRSKIITTVNFIISKQGRIPIKHTG